MRKDSSDAQQVKENGWRQGSVIDPVTVPRLLANWVSKRYRRAAFADEFNERVRKAASKIRDKGKKKGQWISGLYLLVSDDELPGEQPHQITLIGTAKQEVFDDPETRKLAMNFFNQIETVLAGCDGIDMIDAELRSEADVSIADLEHLKRWDYDDLTFRKGGTEAFPADDR